MLHPANRISFALVSLYDRLLLTFLNFSSASVRFSGATSALSATRLLLLRVQDRLTVWVVL